jgi:hypothetical protein
VNCNQFYQYQQNEQSPLIFAEMTEHYKAATTYDVWNLDLDLGQPHTQKNG